MYMKDIHHEAVTGGLQAGAHRKIAVGLGLLEKHVDRHELIERILLLEGLPNVQDIGKVMIGEDVQEALKCDLKLEEIAIPDLRAAVADSETAGDYVSRDLFSAILASEEEHLDWPGVQVDVEPVRDYLYGSLLAHVLGYVGRINEEELERIRTEDPTGTCSSCGVQYRALSFRTHPF